MNILKIRTITRTTNRNIFPVLAILHLFCLFAFGNQFQSPKQADLTEETIEQVVAEAKELQLQKIEQGVLACLAD